MPEWRDSFGSDDERMHSVSSLSCLIAKLGDHT